MTSIDYYQLSEKLQKKLSEFFSNSKVAKLFLVTLIAIIVWYIFLIAHLFYSYKYWQDIKPIATEFDPNNSKYNFKSIAFSHLFGVVNKPGASLADAIKSELPIKLKGVIANVNPKLGSAIILDPDGNEDTYNIGDALPINGREVTLEYVFTDKVYLKNNSVLEYIEYPKLEDKLKGGSGQPSRFEGLNSNNNKKKPSPKSGSSSSNQFLPKADDNIIKTYPGSDSVVPEGMDEKRNKMFELRQKQLQKVSKYKKKIQNMERVL